MACRWGEPSFASRVWGRAPRSRCRASCAVSSAILVLALLLSCTAAEEHTTGPPPAAPTSSIVWITLDTVRADHLGAYGYFRNTSPRFDALASESILFERAYSPIATTLPSHLSALTATYPTEHGVLANVRAGGKVFTPSETLVSLAAFLEERGYATAAFVSATPLKSWSGIQRGFADYDTPEGMIRQGDQTVDLAIAWLKMHRGEKFFLWVHLFDAHAPYEPREGFDVFSGGPDLDRYMSDREIQETAHTLRGIPNDIRETTDRYDGEILFVDTQLGRMLDALKAEDGDEDVAIVVMGDHGEGMGQHGVLRHGHIWGEQLHVPLLIQVPHEAPRRVSTLMSVVDLFPTLLGLVEVPDEDAYLGNVSGLDVLATDEESSLILGQTSARLINFGVPLTYSLTSGNWRFISSSDGHQKLFDLSTDPHELKDLAASKPEVVTKLQAVLNRQVEMQHARHRELGGAGAGEIDKGMLNDLRALGYVEEP